MCHLYRLDAGNRQLQEFYSALLADNFDHDVLTDGRDRYPLYSGAVIRHNPSGERELASLQWGFGDKKYVRKYSTFNARCETIHEKRTYKDAFRSRRCLIPANQFFEPPDNWFTLEAQPLLTLAGIWERHAFTMLTTDANELVAEYRTGRKRMPVILDTPEKMDAWMNPDHVEPGPLRHLFEPLASELLQRTAADP